MSINKKEFIKTLWAWLLLAQSLPAYSKICEENINNWISDTWVKISNCIPEIKKSPVLEDLTKKQWTNFDYWQCWKQDSKKNWLEKGVDAFNNSFFNDNWNKELIYKNEIISLEDVYNSLLQTFSESRDVALTSDEKLYFKQKIQYYQWLDTNRKFTDNEVKKIRILLDELLAKWLLTPDFVEDINEDINNRINELDELVKAELNSLFSRCDPNIPITNTSEEHEELRHKLHSDLLIYPWEMLNKRGEVLTEAIDALESSFKEDPKLFLEKLDLVNQEITILYEDALNFLFNQVSEILSEKELDLSLDTPKTLVYANTKNLLRDQKLLLDNLERLSLKSGKFIEKFDDVSNPGFFELSTKMKRWFQEYYDKKINDFRFFPSDGFNQFEEQLWKEGVISLNTSLDNLQTTIKESLGAKELNKLDYILTEFKKEKWVDFDEFENLLNQLKWEEIKKWMNDPEKYQKELEKLEGDLRTSYDKISQNYKELFTQLTDSIWKRKELFDLFNSIQDELLYIEWALIWLLVLILYWLKKIPWMIWKGLVKVVKKKKK